MARRYEGRLAVLSGILPKWVNNGLLVILTQAEPHAVNPILLFHWGS
jgi:hypothetical protein